MKYRKDKYGNELSILGYGCMRFTQKAGRIDVHKAGLEIMAAYEGGVNYFDTAYVYGGSEAALGEILEAYRIRDKVNIATKLPHYLIKSRERAEELFQQELKRLRTDHVDYYLMHMLNDPATWQRLDALGIGDWLREKQAAGQIGQVGFSYHGNSDKFMKLLDSWDWDFCQIQYNYLDEHSQAGRTGIEYAGSKGIPVIIMEPLRGGKLVSHLPDKAKKAFRESGRDLSPAGWGFSWLWDQPQVTCVLSGMNSLEMVRENIAAAEKAEAGMFGPEDFATLAKVVDSINEKMKVPCTGCRYCMPCPQGVDIPGIFAAYNNRYTDGWFESLREYIMTTTLRRDYTGPKACVECGACKVHCPQGIDIPEELKKARKALEGPAYKVAKAAIPHIMKY